MRDGAEADGSRPMPVFRHEFVLRAKPKNAVLRIVGLGQWHASIGHEGHVESVEPGRVANGPLTAKAGPRAAMFFQGALTMAGGALMISTNSAVLIIAGCALAGLGLAGVAPTTLSLAERPFRKPRGPRREPRCSAVTAALPSIRFSPGPWPRRFRSASCWRGFWWLERWCWRRPSGSTGSCAN